MQLQDFLSIICFPNPFLILFQILCLCPFCSVQSLSNIMPVCRCEAKNILVFTSMSCVLRHWELSMQVALTWQRDSI